MSTLRDRDGIVHIALRPNDEDAWWTPIACGGGINLPGYQRDERVTCPECARDDESRPAKDGSRTAG